MSYRLLQVSAIMFATAVSVPAFAGGYVGAGAGQASADVCGELHALGATRCDDEDTGFKIFGGYQVNENFAVEGSYVDYGDITASDGEVSLKGEITAFAISGVGVIPVTEQFSIFGKLGVAFWDAEASASGFGSVSDDGTDLTYGVGAGFDVTDAFGLRGEWERLDSDGDDVDLLSVSAVLKF